MYKIRNIEKKLDDLKNKRQQNGIKTCYSNLDSLSDIMQELNNNMNWLVYNHNTKLIEICEKEKNANIQYIINLSFISFIDNINSNKDFKPLLKDIKKSSFYNEYKNDEKIKKMENFAEIFDIKNEIEKNNKYRKGLEQFEKLEKQNYDDEIKKILEENIEKCKKGIVNNEIEEIIKQLDQNNFKQAINIFENILNEFKYEINLSEDIKKTYMLIIERFETEIEQGNKYEKELTELEDIINKNKDFLDDYDEFIQSLENLKSMVPGKKMKKKENIKENQIILQKFPDNNKKNKIKRKKEAVGYIKEIKKLIPKDNLKAFQKHEQYINEQIINFENEEKINFVNAKKWISDRKKYQKEIRNIKNIGKIFAYFNHINEGIEHFDIHTIQLISLLLLSKEKAKNIKGVFCKINTGEGKSTIIQFFAAYKVLSGHKVDIISSSAVLAERDALNEEKRKFFNDLEISVGFVREEAKNSEKEEIYSLDIVYGDTNQFSADFLLQDYEFIPTRNDREFDVVIIDEVDNMCIDNLETKTMLTKRFPGYQSLYTFYYIIIYVFNFIAFEMELTNGKQDIENNRAIIKEAILRRLKGNKFDLKKLFKETENDVMNELDEYLLKERKKIEKSDNEVSTKYSSNESNEEEEDKKFGKRIQKILTEDNKLFGENNLGILYPKCLTSEIEDHIEYWIDSVITSFSMVENIDFKIKKAKKKYKKIIPIDHCNTGVSQKSMVWNDALHQILQIIHDVEVFPENINTNFLLIISFFRKYKELYGLTGTIGSETNQKTLKDLYKVELYFIPPNLKSQLTKRTEIFFFDQSKWEEKIANEIKEIIRENRSVLLICSSIKKGEYFKEMIKRCGITNIKTYFTEEDEDVVKEKLEQKYVIVATNLAGRGTDIKITDDLEKAGGLHVIVSFLPMNQRVEDQNYGRAGRNGQKGSYSLIFKYNSDNPFLTVDAIKKKREEDEKRMVENFNEKDLKNAEELFEDYCEYRKKYLKDCGDDYIKEDNEYSWGLIFNSKKSYEEKKKMLQNLKKRELSFENIKNPLIKIKYYIQEIKYFDDENIFIEEKFYSWALKMKYATQLVLDNKDKKIIDKAKRYYKEAVESLKEFQTDIKSQIILYLFIVQSLKKKENSNDENEKTKTKIEEQNDRKKTFLQIIIDIIEQNIKVLEEFEREQSPEKYIEISERFDIKKIYVKLLLKKKDDDREKDKNKNKKNNDKFIDKNIDEDEIKDLTLFMGEFGLETVETIRIVEKPDFMTNYIVLVVGVIEVVVGTLIVIYAPGPKLQQFGKFLIKQGFNDIVEAFKSALEGKGINMKDWGERKAIECLKGILSIAIGNVAGKVISFKAEIAKAATSYAMNKVGEYSYKYLVNEGGNKIQELCTKHITTPILKQIENEIVCAPQLKLIVIDLVNDDKYFEKYLIESTQFIIETIKNSQILNKLFKTIKNLTKKNSAKEFLAGLVLDLAPLLIKSGLDLKKYFEEIFDCKKQNFSDKMKGDELYFRFDGSLKSLILKQNQSYNNNAKKIDQICQELIRYNVIDINGKINTDKIDNKNLDQGFLLEISEEFKQIIPVNNNDFESSHQILGLNYNERIKYIKDINDISFCFDKRKIDKKKNEIHQRVTREVMKLSKIIIDELISCLTNKIDKYIDKKVEEERKEKEEKERKKKRRRSIKK